jgi:hypothetical protein
MSSGKTDYSLTSLIIGGVVVLLLVGLSAPPLLLLRPFAE